MNQRIHFRAKFLFLLCFIITGSFLSAEEWASVVEEIGPGVAKIQLETSQGRTVSQGTGFVITDTQGRERLITNAHVIRRAHFDPSVQITVLFPYQKDEPREYPGLVESYDAGIDLASLSLEETAPQVMEMGEKEPPPLMSEIIVLGYPLSQSFKVTPGVVQAVQEVEERGPMIDISANLAPGNSGGPVINQQGQVIGIATSMIPGYNFNLAIPISRLRAFLNTKENSRDIEITANVADAWFFIDGEYRGKAPASISLRNREHSLRIEKQGYSAVEETIGPWDQNDLPPLSFTLEEKEAQLPAVTITTTPPGAEIFVNKKSLGESPVTLSRPPNRILRIKAVLKGHQEAGLEHTVTEEAEQTIEITLEEKGWFW